MTAPTIPSFQIIGLEKLQVLDLSWNYVNYFANNTFENMTSLIILDIRGNNIFSPVPQGLFKHLINIKTLQITGEQCSYEKCERFIEETRCLKSLDTFVFKNGDITFGIQIASQYTNITSFSMNHCGSSDFTLSFILYQLRNLRKLT